MRRSSSLLFILINILVSLGVVLIAISLLNNSRPQESSQSPMVITVPVVITTTPNPNAGPTLMVITATLPAGVVQLPTNIINEIEQQTSGTLSALPTLDQTQLADGTTSPLLASAATALPQNCIPVTLESGDTPAGLSVEYDVSVFDILAVNGLSEEDAAFLQIGQSLIIPLEGCPLTALAIAATETGTFEPTATISPTPSNTSQYTDTPESTATSTSLPTETPSSSPTPTGTFTPSHTPTSTLPPTAANAQVAIVRIVDPGNITAEAVEIRNNGPVVDLSGWSLRDNDGNNFVFPNERRLFQGGQLTIFTRVGDDTPIALYWDREQAAFSSGESVTLTDREGRAQSVFTVP
ncbi:MAG: hypothetical protein UZ15_CFX003001098 [Chloroflexi bacterium OLB15]|nr:MAG: hypothetical protein UZ15_CFX003001098 [Chloroflexi bacterium OLB15]